VPVCRDTDRSAPLRHPEYLVAVEATLSCPATFAHFTEERFKKVVYDVANNSPSLSSVYMARAQRLVRRVKGGCSSRPAFCIMICQLFDLPDEMVDTAFNRAYRKHVVRTAAREWDDAYRSRAACKEHHGEWDDEVRTQTHGYFE